MEIKLPSSLVRFVPCHDADGGRSVTLDSIASILDLETWLSSHSAPVGLECEQEVVRHSAALYASYAGRNRMQSVRRALRAAATSSRKQLTHFVRCVYLLSLQLASEAKSSEVEKSVAPESSLYTLSRLPAREGVVFSMAMAYRTLAV